jgi:putative endonuclease
MFEQKTYYVYIMASKRNGTLYTGISSQLEIRAQQHKHGEYEGFTKKYSVHLLVYYEMHEDVYEAIAREKQIKKWLRKWKLALIEKHNPHWIDLVCKDGEILPLPR